MKKYEHQLNINFSYNAFHLCIVVLSIKTQLTELPSQINSVQQFSEVTAGKLKKLRLDHFHRTILIVIMFQNSVNVETTLSRSADDKWSWKFDCVLWNKSTASSIPGFKEVTAVFIVRKRSATKSSLNVIKLRFKMTPFTRTSFLYNIL